MSSLYGQKSIVFRPESDVHVEMQYSEYARTILEQVSNKRRKGASVLVFIETEAAMSRWEKSGYAKDIEELKKVTIATENVDFYLTHSTRSMQVTPLTHGHNYARTPL